MKKSVVAIIVLIVLGFGLLFYSGVQILNLAGLQVLELPPPPPPPGVEFKEEAAPTLKVVDSDAAQPKPENVFGKCTVDGRVVCTDECITPTILRECYAAENQCKDKSITCPGSCVGGACKPAAPNATAAAAAALAAAEAPTTVPTEDLAALAVKVDMLEAKSKALDLLPGFENRINIVEQKMYGLEGLGSRLEGVESRLGGLETDVSNLKVVAARPFVEMPVFEELFESLKLLIRRNAFLNLGLSIAALLLVTGLILTLVLRQKKIAEHNKKLIKQYLNNYTKVGYKLETLEMHLKASGWREEEIQEALKELKLK